MNVELRTRLEREARQVSATPDAFEAMLRRGRRRKTGARLATIALALVIAAAGLAGALISLRPTRAAHSADGGGWPGIWPQQSLEEAQAAQGRADAGDLNYTWQLDAETVLHRFAYDQLGWNGLTFLEIRTGGPGSEAPAGYNNQSDLADPDASGPFRLIVAGCTDLGPGVTCPDATVTIERILRHDRTGIWTVTKVEDQGTAAGAYPSQSP